MDSSSSTPASRHSSSRPRGDKDDKGKPYLHRGTYKEKFHVLRERYDQVTATHEGYQRDLDLASARIKKLQAENDLLLDAMNLAAPHPSNPSYASPPPLPHPHAHHPHASGPPPPDDYYPHHPYPQHPHSQRPQNPQHPQPQHPYSYPQPQPQPHHRQSSSSSSSYPAAAPIPRDTGDEHGEGDPRASRRGSPRSDRTPTHARHASYPAPVATPMNGNGNGEEGNGGVQGNGYGHTSANGGGTPRPRGSEPQHDREGSPAEYKYDPHGDDNSNGRAS